MTALSKTKTVDATIGTIQEVKYMVGPVATEAANANDPVALTLFARLVTFFESWTQSSYESWVKSGQPNDF